VLWDFLHPYCKVIQRGAMPGFFFLIFFFFLLLGERPPPAEKSAKRGDLSFFCQPSCLDKIMAGE
jgi:hypothetical protein